MYTTCIFCSAKLGRNESVAEFPVGRTLAFDAAKGRLWAVCGSCGRWNLAPIHERWEAVETSEKLFADARLRVQSENVGLAKLRDGTRLIRIGQALAGEMAAWRYGTQLVRRHRRYLAAGAVGVAGLVAPQIALHWSALAGFGLVLLQWARVGHGHAEIVHKRWKGMLAPEPLRRRDLHGLSVSLGARGVVIHRNPRPVGPEIQGDEALAALAKAMVHVNSQGARPRLVSRALDVLGTAESPDAYVAGVAAERRVLRLGVGAYTWRRMRLEMQTLDDVGDFVRHHAEWALGQTWDRRDVRQIFQPAGSPLRVDEALALEMALHEQSERRAMEGELSMLEAAWREAEDIARIADALPDDPPELNP